MKKHTVLFTALWVFIAPAFLSPQAVSTAAELDALLESPAVSRGQAIRFVLASAETGDSGMDAIERAMNSRQLPLDEYAGAPVNLGELSYLMMRAFSIPGGLLYTLFPGPRYAFRALMSRSIIQGEADPSMTVSGERFLEILGSLLTYLGG
jgi:hypothetical protein